MHVAKYTNRQRIGMVCWFAPLDLVTVHALFSTMHHAPYKQAPIVDVFTCIIIMIMFEIIIIITIWRNCL